jgi:hypothetical protein
MTIYAAARRNCPRLGRRLELPPADRETRAGAKRGFYGKRIRLFIRAARRRGGCAPGLLLPYFGGAAKVLVIKCAPRHLARATADSRDVFEVVAVAFEDVIERLPFGRLDGLRALPCVGVNQADDFGFE